MAWKCRLHLEGENKARRTKEIDYFFIKKRSRNRKNNQEEGEGLKGYERLCAYTHVRIIFCARVRKTGRGLIYGAHRLFFSSKQTHFDKIISTVIKAQLS